MSGMEAEPLRSAYEVGDQLQTALFRRGRTFSGFACDPSDPTRKFVIELVVDGYVVAVGVADGMVARLREDGLGDGRFGFTFSVADEALANATCVEARLANLGVAVGAPIYCDSLLTDEAEYVLGELEWVGGLRFVGWLDPELEDDVEIVVAEQLVMLVKPSGWTHVAQGDGFEAAKRLDFHLPEHYADGRVRQLSARLSDGRSLLAQALPFVAFERGLEQTLQVLGRWESERLRGRLFDQLVPASLPFHLYESWKERFPPPGPVSGSFEAAVILIGESGVDETVESLEAQRNCTWSAISLPTARSFARFDAKPAWEFIGGDAAGCEFVVFCLSGTFVTPDALRRLGEVFEVDRRCDGVYSDIEIQSDGKLWPLMLPAFDRERALEQAYGAYFFAVRRACALETLRSAMSLYELFHACVGNELATRRVRHLPGALAILPVIDTASAVKELAEASRSFLARSGIRAAVSPRENGSVPSVRIQREVAANDSTTIVIPTRNRGKLLQRCLDTIEPAVRKLQAKVLVVDNESTEPETMEYLARIAALGVGVLPVPGHFNFARINNIAIRQVDTENVCLLNNDIEALDDDWLSEMLSRLSEPNVGAVGAKLLWPNGVVQHGGVVLGTNFAATHAFNDRMDGDLGYGGLLQVAHECSAVTAACLLIRKRDYDAVQGMDEVRFPVNFNDVDLCLKLRQLGKRIVITPDARLTHLESVSRGRDTSPDRKARFERELLNLRIKWGDALMDDPYYHPLLGLDHPPFSALAWPPRSWASRVNRRPHPEAAPPGF
ncbi:Putative Glycosyl transferase, group 2 [Bradyrhizobium sp. ORS 278]|uniref:glycosyltransferase family 2 protein n=1 Tax=Bradyrhizobium sp. (strain ORS 278) TaxID=114615 RepID=UPI00015083F7|nr:glycosyltransferase [Bradyrhizobium sp. ORS 278]CAL80611.1 Putative Glycosyl transferase, group 2 [Bradyrhizobium sp. ORS 278]